MGRRDNASYHVDGLDLRWSEWLVDVTTAAAGPAHLPASLSFRRPWLRIMGDINRAVKLSKESLGNRTNKDV